MVVPRRLERNAHSPKESEIHDRSELRMLHRAMEEALKPLVLVTGGTGLQGSGCIRDLLASQAFRIRTISRNPESKECLKLRESGVEVVRGDMRDRVSLDVAMQGVYAVFAATFSEHDGTEVQMGRDLGDAAVRAGVERLVFSGGERIGVDAMDYKAHIEEYLRTLPLVHAVYLHTAFFFESIATKKGTKRVKVDKQRTHYTFSIPLLQDVRVPFISPTDIGRFAAFVIVSPPERFKHGEVIAIAGDVLSPLEFVQTFSRVTGKQASYEQLSLDFFRRLPIPGAELIVHMYEWYHQGCPGEGHDRDPSAIRRMCPHVRSAEEWLASDGVHLIERMAYVDDTWHRAKKLLIEMLMHVFGAVMRVRRWLLVGTGGGGKKDD